MAVKNRERKVRYYQLRKVGFSSDEATKFKDLSISKIEELIEVRHKYNESIKMQQKQYLEALKEILNG